MESNDNVKPGENKNNHAIMAFFRDSTGEQKQLVWGLANFDATGHNSQHADFKVVLPVMKIQCHCNENPDTLKQTLW